jgi:2-amino-4-hydroxy-6-hydroxymethyldihydropteridine diphosphokinase
MAEAYIGMGSNLGDKRRNLLQALDEICRRTDALQVSSVYRTEPVGKKDQDWFLNAVARIRTELPPRDLLEFLLDVEQRMGRTREEKDGPRTIDLDILYYDDLVVVETGLAIPHPRLHERMFVLAPLAEIAPEFLHPRLGKTTMQLVAGLHEHEKVESLSTLDDGRLQPGFTGKSSIDS